jgi:hypothetical protein
MNHFHDPIRQLKYLRQTLSQNKKPLGFFLAAGCPLAVKTKNGPLIPDINGLTQSIEKDLNSDKKYKVLIEELKKTGNFSPNIEDILSFTRNLKMVATGAASVRGLKEAELEILEKKICEKIVDKMDVSLPNYETPYHFFAHWIHLFDRGESPIECFTTNYDLLLEQAFEETGVAYFDGFVGARRPFFDLRAIEDSLIPKHWTRLWKMHGSINWFLDEKKEVYRSTDIRNCDSYIIHPSHLKYDQSRKMPYLALIDRMSAFLRQTSAILITTGYSFNDIHLNNTIINALKANPTAMVIALLYGNATTKNNAGEIIFNYQNAFNYAKQRYNLSAWAFDEAIIGGQQGKWKISNLESLETDNIAESIVRDAHTNGSDLNTECELHLGDFAKLGEFLQEVIGLDQFKNDT